jgi:hypothetical protein
MKTNLITGAVLLAVAFYLTGDWRTGTNAAEASTLGPSDLSAMTTVSNQNEVRFMQQYAGKVFEGTMPFRNAWAMSPELANLYFGPPLYSGPPGTPRDFVACAFVEDRRTLDRAAAWNKGELIKVRGTVKGPYGPDGIYLTECSFE